MNGVRRSVGTVWDTDQWPVSRRSAQDCPRDLQDESINLRALSREDYRYVQLYPEVPATMYPFRDHGYPAVDVVDIPLQ